MGLIEVDAAAPNVLDGQNVTHYDHGAIYAKQVLIRSGETFLQHSHTHAHTSILASGRAKITVNGITEERTGPGVLLIHGSEPHSIEAVTDCVWFCIHALK
jgi:quercetin dioxygenase-like cupin family protein